MADVVAGRMTVAMEGDVVVFVIGMRVNRWWKVHKWLPVAVAMPRMLRELWANPAHGFLHAEIWFARTIVLIQYWRSVDALNAYAKARDQSHLPVWKAFNARVGDSGDVGVYHETYRVSAGDRECVYVNMPPFGLGSKPNQLSNLLRLCGFLVFGTGIRGYGKRVLAL